MNRASNIYAVLTANPKGHHKNITVRGRDKSSITVRVHRFAVVGKGDRIRFGAAGSNRVFVVPKGESEPYIPLSPLFNTDDSVSIGKDKFDLRIKEVHSEQEMQALEFLEQFHYKTNSSLVEIAHSDERKNATTSVGGRRAVLYAALKIGERWLPAGYIDLQMPLMMCKPRHDLFNHPFTHPDAILRGSAGTSRP